MQRVLCSGVLQRIVIKPPCRVRSYGIKSFCPYRATLFLLTLPRVLPWAMSFCPFQGDRGKPCFFCHAKPPGSFYLFTFLPLFVCPNHKFIFSYLCTRNIKRKMKTYEKERDYSTTLDCSSDDDAGSMCLFSTGG